MNDNRTCSTDGTGRFELIFERCSKLSVEQIWKGWTDPETLKKWYCPKPWSVTDCRIELRNGGEFYTVMRGPDDEHMENHGCYLQVEINKTLIWTNMMTQGFRPVAENPMGFANVAVLSFSEHPDGSFFRAVVYHTDELSKKKHQDMGFYEGWGIAFQQLESIYV